MNKKTIYFAVTAVGLGLTLFTYMVHFGKPLEKPFTRYSGHCTTYDGGSGDVGNFEVYVRLTSSPAFREQLENWLLKSIELFYPKNLASLVLVFDNEKLADRRYAGDIMHIYDRLNLRVCYVDPIPESFVHKWGKERMYLDMMHADFCKMSGYVGFVDVDTLFVTAVTQDLLFENGKPIVTGRIGAPRVPCWIDTAEYVLGLKQVMQCMSFFPVIFKVEHIMEMRRYVEKLHGKPFVEVFKIAPAAVKVASTCFCHYSIMCNYLWYFYRNSYAWHLQMVPAVGWNGKDGIPSMVNATYFQKEVLPSEKVPVPRSSIHARHFMLNGKYQNAVKAPLRYTNGGSSMVPLLLSHCAGFLRNALRQGFIHRLGRKQISFLFIKRVADNVKITIGLFLCFQFLERSLKNYCSTKFTPIFV